MTWLVLGFTSLCLFPFAAKERIHAMARERYSHLSGLTAPVTPPTPITRLSAFVQVFHDFLLYR